VDEVAEQYRPSSHRVSAPGREEVAEEPNPVGGRGKILPIDNGPSIYVGGSKPERHHSVMPFCGGSLLLSSPLGLVMPSMVCNSRTSLTDFLDWQV